MSHIDFENPETLWAVHDPDTHRVIAIVPFSVSTIIMSRFEGSYTLPHTTNPKYVVKDYCIEKAPDNTEARS